MLHENIPAKTFARMDSACADQFRSFVIDQQYFKYEANTSAFLKDLEFSIKLSSVRANCSTLECQGKKNNNNNNKQKEQNEPFSFTKVHNFINFFNNNSRNSLKIHFICLVKKINWRVEDEISERWNSCSAY